MEILVVVAIPALAYFVWLQRTRKVAPESAWRTAGAGTTDVVPVRGSTRSVVRSLGRSEASLLARSAALLQGIVFCVLMLVFLYIVFDPTEEPLWNHLAIFPIMAHPLAGMALIANHRAVLRGRRDDSEELFSATPTSPATRTLGHAVAAWVPVTIAALFWAVVVVAAQSVTSGSVNTTLLVDGVTGVALVAGACWLGILLARCLPYAVAPIIALVAILIASSAIGDIGGRVWSPLRQLSTWPRYPNHDLLFTARPVVAHLVYIVGLACGCLVIAVAVHRRTRAVFGFGIIALALTIAGGVLATRPMSGANARRLAALVADPTAHQACRERGRVRACAFPEYAELLDRWIPAADAALAGAPTGTTSRPFVLSQRLQADRIDDLAPEIRRVLGPRFAGHAFAWRDDGAFHTGFVGNDAATTSVRIAAGLWATGSPLEARAQGRPCVIAGQARGILALWVAFHDLPLAGGLERVQAPVPDPHNSSHLDPALEAGSAWPDTASVPAPVVWSAPDLSAARTLLAQPHDRIRTALWANWGRFSNPTTTTDEMLTTLGLTTVRTPPTPPPDIAICR